MNKKMMKTTNRLFLLFYSWLIQCSCALSVPKVSFVTGANGYVGKEVVLALLQEFPEDHKIVCCVRESNIARIEDYWKDYGCISVAPYDMLDGGSSLEKAMGSVEAKDLCVYHVASVFGPTDDHRQTALDNVKGTEDLIKVASKFKGCKVIVTSSMAAVRGSGQTPLNGKWYTHEDWNTFSELGKNWGNSYQWSKAESEKRAWELSKELGVPMISMCPAFVFGPSADAKFDSGSYSITLVRQWINGESEVQSRLCIDVRDIARAQILAANADNAVGKRFIVSAERRLTSQATAQALKEFAADPDAITYDANFDGGAIKIGDQEVESLDRLKKELGMELTSIDKTFRDMANALQQEDAQVDKAAKE